MNKHLSVLILLLVCISQTQLPAQNSYRGVPIIKNYTKSDYGGAPENWTVVQDSTGFIYLGNQYGLFKNFGTRWEIVFQPTNKSIIRSAVHGKGDTLYIGAQNELGFLITEANGQIRFNSLIHLIPEEYRNFDDVWTTIYTSDAVWFQTCKYIFVYKAGNWVCEIQTNKSINTDKCLFIE